jgi:hypothetical protein
MGSFLTSGLLTVVVLMVRDVVGATAMEEVVVEGVTLSALAVEGVAGALAGTVVGFVVTKALVGVVVDVARVKVVAVGLVAPMASVIVKRDTTAFQASLSFSFQAGEAERESIVSGCCHANKSQRFWCGTSHLVSRDGARSSVTPTHK